tara:strand:+ start:320 stop:475 length:156 start_codon:yes stop_codon:yes gene_type:complete
MEVSPEVRTGRPLASRANAASAAAEAAVDQILNSFQFKKKKKKKKSGITHL